MGGCLDAAGREKFDVLLRKLLNNQPPEEYRLYITGDARKVAKPFPDDADRLVFDYIFQADQQKWTPWLEKGTSHVDTMISSGLHFSKLIVPTAETVCMSFLLDKHILKGHPILFAGPTGTGKSVCVKDYLESKLDPSLFQSIAFTFSAQTSANQTQDIIDGKLEKRRKGYYGPPLGQRCVVFIDDLNMPQVEKYGAQPPVELLRQVRIVSLVMGESIGLGWIKLDRIGLHMTRPFLFLLSRPLTTADGTIASHSP